MVPHLAALAQLLAGFLDDTNFKISLTSLQMISDVLDRFGEQIRHGPDSLAIASAIVPKLMEKFADNKIVIRQSNLKVRIESGGRESRVREARARGARGAASGAPRPARPAGLFSPAFSHRPPAQAARATPRHRHS